MKLCVIALLLFLTGCATTSSQNIQLSLSRCPTLKQYTKEQLIQAAEELKKMPEYSQISIMIIDYGKLRDACKLADKSLKKLNRYKYETRTNN